MNSRSRLLAFAISQAVAASHVAAATPALEPSKEADSLSDVTLTGECGSGLGGRSSTIGGATCASSRHRGVMPDITVNTLADRDDTDGYCALSEAIYNANTDTATWADCPAGSGDDVIGFADGLLTDIFDTLDFFRTEVIESNITIQGDGTSNGALSGRGYHQMFYVAPAGELTIRDMTVQSGNSFAYPTGNVGGCFVVTGTLNLERSVVRLCTAETGAAIGGYGTANVDSSSFFNNQSNPPGYATGNATISAVSLTMTNSTVANNFIGFGYVLEASDLTLNHVTVADNSSSISSDYSWQGIRAINTLSMQNSIVADIANSDCSASTISLDQYNLISDDSCSTGDPYRLTGDPQLASLAGSGLPGLHPLPGSPVIDAAAPLSPRGMAACLPFDQNGLERPLDGDGQDGAACDVGALEYQDISPPMAGFSSQPVTTPGATSHDIVVLFFDAGGTIDPAGIAANNLTISLPARGTIVPDSVSTDILPDGSIEATYSFTPPDGSWDAGDAGQYPVAMAADAVFDNADPTPLAVPAGQIGAVSVNFDLIFADQFEGQP